MIAIAKLLSVLIMLAVGGLAFVFVDDRVVAEKLLTELAMPVGLIWLTSAFALIVAGFRRQRLLFVLMLTVFAGLSIAGNAMTGIRLIRQIERPYLENNPLEQPALDGIVVLGGATTVGANGITRLGWAGDRVLLALRLFHDGKAPRIYCTGSRVLALDRIGRDPMDITADILMDAGVPANAIERVPGINTSEEMRQLGDRLPANSRVGLVTSAFHMPRAMRLARGQGLELIPLPAQVLTPPSLELNLLDIVPDADSLLMTRVACKEFLARLVGR